MIELIILTFTLFVSSFLFHEIGHLIIASKYTSNTYIKISKLELTTTFPDELTKKQKENIFIAGILLGTLPLIVLSMYAGPIIPISLTIAYLLGCRSDFQQIADLNKKNDIEKNIYEVKNE